MIWVGIICGVKIIKYVFTRPKKYAHRGPQSLESKKEDLTAFFFGASPFENIKDSSPVNDDYYKGPEW